MRITSIFTEIIDRLYAVAYDDRGNVLNQLQDNWSDVIWLEQFFEDNRSDLQNGFYGTITIEEAIERTIDDADDLLFRLNESDSVNLDELFRPLNNDDYKSRDFQELKAKGNERRSWIRIYAVRYNDGYVITGGAIKLTHTMQERTHTNDELRKLRMVRDALRLNEADELFVYLDL